jgi:hypothetical protein
VQGQTGPSWQDGADVWVLAPKVVRFVRRRRERGKNSLVTMCARCFFVVAVILRIFALHQAKMFRTLESARERFSPN